MNSEIDYKYTLDLYKRICAVNIGDRKVHDHFIVDGYNYWQFYEQRIFEEIKIFSRNKKIVTPDRAVLISIKDLLGHLILAAFSIVSFLLLCISRRKVLIYSVDRVNSSYKNDFRLDEIYRFLFEKKIKYSELFHTVLGSAALHNLLKRRRPGFYLETLAWFGRVCVAFGFGSAIDTSFVRDANYSRFSREEEEFAQSILARYSKQIRISKFKITVLKTLLPLTNIKCLLAIDDARYYYEVLLGCQLAGVKTYAFQHGHFTKYHVGWLNTCDLQGKMVSPHTYLVWSQYWKDELRRLGNTSDPAMVIVGGAKPTAGPRENLSNRSLEKITVLIPYETACPKSEVTSFVRKMLSCPHTSVVFKLRLDIGKEQQLLEYNLGGGELESFSTVTDVQEVIQEVSVVAGVYSTFLYDMVAYEKPILMLETSSDYGEGMLVNGLADKLPFDDLVCQSLQKASNQPREALRKKREKLYGIEQKSLYDSLCKLAVESGIIEHV